MTSHSIISPPETGEYPASSSEYLALVPSDDLLGYFDIQSESVATIAAGLTEGQLLYRYAEGKWSIKDIFNHVIDCERIYCYRALSIARGEKVTLPGFDENDYAREAKSDKRDIRDIVAEYKAVRAATIQLFKSFDPQVLDRIGVANNAKRSVRSLGYLAAGHELHHLNVIKERYLSR